jgi:hypothetical protein
MGAGFSKKMLKIVLPPWCWGSLRCCLVLKPRISFENLEAKAVDLDLDAKAPM